MASQHVEEFTPPRSSSNLIDVTEKRGHSASLAALAFGALGVVFGDIGTSPLYTLKECLHAAGGERASIPADLFGILSLMFWALIFVVTIKYLVFVMRADHDGEGGIFALLAIVPDRFRTRAATNGRVTGMALLAVIGAALLYGDGVITPAISVLSAVEGLKIASPHCRLCRTSTDVWNSRRTFRHPAAWYWRHWQVIRPGHDCLVYHDGNIGHLLHHPEARNPNRTFPVSWSRLFRAEEFTACSFSDRSSWP